MYILYMVYSIRSSANTNTASTVSACPVLQEGSLQGGLRRAQDLSKRFSAYVSVELPRS